ncbi:hypothetical protein CONCODRAFT_4499 [Conidiobolus coronatus NRRL 28638]|uniref:Uncharacterized protein n=1 Tax=Conidiobolus coronatus (strain ATCC 28846 / CBS 209.66 / NRRL 28638) TaxID=796925 RepID=A0A137PCH0_CONC2|nr:hypothetical protein CONCODRAFT_4499 [Conidiobolus coronatus NRRL 28638]|eukprot:KXN72641.1 hypothetical protein CONCODRAFT_4499 [Conidiobolus coronatus NRRL 28638]
MIYNQFIVASLCSLILGSELTESSSVIYAPAFIVTPLSDAENFQSISEPSAATVQETKPISFDSHSVNAHTSEQRVTIAEYTGISTTSPSTSPSSSQGKESEIVKSGSHPAYDWFGLWGASRSGDTNPEAKPETNSKPEGPKAKNTKPKTNGKPSTQQNLSTQPNQQTQSNQSSQSTQSSSIQASSVTTSSSTSNQPANQPSKPSSSKPAKSEEQAKASNSNLPSILYTPTM